MVVAAVAAVVILVAVVVVNINNINNKIIRKKEKKERNFKNTYEMYVNDLLFSRMLTKHSTSDVVGHAFKYAHTFSHVEYVRENIHAFNLTADEGYG